jgi:aspartyl-tRNA(Asn)/glutamyl-tRNA(Gln) amidotransferase subunit A
MSNQGIAEQKAKFYLDKIKKEDKKINSFLYVNEDVINEAKDLDEKVKKTGRKGRLYGYVIAVKSVINVKGMPASCASKVLETYISTYDATVVKKIKDEDGLIIGILNCDEFACGGSGENSAFGATENPAAPGRVPGGSSSGSAAAVAAGFCDVSLGTDTGGSIRNPASHCGIIGIKPSYGLVSRYGLIDLSMSLDQVGPMARNLDDAVLLLDVIRGKDEKDTISFESKPIEIKPLKKVKVGVVKIKGVDRKIHELFEKKISEMKKMGWEVEEVEIRDIDLAVQTYYPIVYAEIFSGTRKLDGRRFGKNIEKHCGEEVLRRILGGSEITKAEFAGRYYQKALEVRELIKQEFDEVLKDYDCLVMPTVPGLPWKMGEGKKMKIEEIYAYDALTIPANLAGICAISVPMGKIDGVPTGLQIMCGKGEESKMASIAKLVNN